MLVISLKKTCICRMRSRRISSLLARRCLNGSRYITNMPQEFQDRFTMEADVEKELLADEIWIKSETALRAMKLGKKEPTKHIESMEMGHHIIARNYESADHPDESCRRVISSCMTFPLTLGYAHKLLLPAVPSRPNILMIGARAESSLPSVWWKDCLYNNGALEGASIKMTGPGIKKRPEKHAALTDTIDVPSDVEILEWKVPQLDHCESDGSPELSYSQISLPSPYNENNMKLLHENSDAMQLLLWADIFVLYNPGTYKERSSKCMKSSYSRLMILLLTAIYCASSKL